MSFKLGKIQIIIGLIGILFAILKKNKPLILLAIFGILAALLATNYSKLFWDLSSILQIVQFPWRALGIVTIILSILSGYAVSRVPMKILRIVSGIAIVGLLVVLNYKYFTPQSIINSPLDKMEISEDEIPDISSVVPEYAPFWWHPELIEYEIGFQIITPENVFADEDSQGLQGRQDWGYSVDLIATQDSVVTFALAYYPTWEGRVDGKKVEVKPDKSGLATMAIPEGKHRLTLKQSHTNLEKLSVFVSLITLIIMIKIYVKK